MSFFKKIAGTREPKVDIVDILEKRYLSLDTPLIKGKRVTQRDLVLY